MYVNLCCNVYVYMLTEYLCNDWLAVYVDKSEAVITQLAVHVIISHSYLCMTYGARLDVYLNKCKSSNMKHDEVDYNTHKSYKICLQKISSLI